MLIHFIASRSSLKDDMPVYSRVLETVQKTGHILTTDWLHEAYELTLTDKGYDALDWPAIFRQDMESLAKTDVVIADVSNKSFAVGFHVAMALNNKKPTLLLQREGYEKSKTGYYAEAARHDVLSHKVYTEKTLPKIVTDFINENQIDNKDLRFNFFIDRKIYNYLRWAAYRTGKTKAEILRELVQREIDEREYQSS